MVIEFKRKDNGNKALLKTGIFNIADQQIRTIDSKSKS